MADGLEHDLDPHAGAPAKGDKPKGDKERQHRLAVIAVVVGIVGAILAYLSYRKTGSSSSAPTSTGTAGYGLGSGTVASAGGATDATTGQLSALGQAVEGIRAQLAGGNNGAGTTPDPGAGTQAAYDDSWIRQALQQLAGQQATTAQHGTPQGSQAGAVNVGAQPTQAGLTNVQRVFNDRPPVASTYYQPSALDRAASVKPITYSQTVAGANGAHTATIISGAPTNVAGGPIVDTSKGGRLIADEQYVNLGNGRYQVKL